MGLIRLVRYIISLAMVVMILTSLTPITFHPINAESAGTFLNIRQSGSLIICEFGNEYFYARTHTNTGLLAQLQVLPYQQYMNENSATDLSEELPWLFDPGSNTTNYTLSWDLKKIEVVKNTTEKVVVTAYSEGPDFKRGSHIPDIDVDVNRTYTVIGGVPLLFVTTTFKNLGNTTIDKEFYQYLDLIVAGNTNDYVVAPLAGEGPSRIDSITYIPRDRLAEPWVWVKDTATPYSLGIIIGNQALFNGIYVTTASNSLLGRPPFKAPEAGGVIPWGDIAVALSWNLTIPPGETASITYAYAYAENETALSMLADEFFSYSNLNFTVEAPDDVFWGFQVPVEVSLDNVMENYKVDYNLSINWSNGLDPISDTQPVTGTLESSEGTTVDWTFIASQDYYGVAKVNVTLDFRVYNDTGTVYQATVKKTLDITVEPTPYNGHVTNVSSVDAGGTITFNHTVPLSLYHYTTLTLGARPDLPYLEGLQSLLGYPFGCNEQYTSKALGLVYALNYMEDIGEIDMGTAIAQQDKIVRSILTLMSRQNNDGGWGWYPDMESTPFFTAYVLKGITENYNWLQEHQVTLPSSYQGKTLEEVVADAMNYLQQNMNSDGSFTPSGGLLGSQVKLTAFILDTVSRTMDAGLYDDAGLVNVMASYLISRFTGQGWPAEPDGSPDPYTTALVIAALSKISPILGDSYPDLSNMLADAADWLASSATINGDMAYWEAPRTDTVIATSQAVEALSEVGGHDDLVAAGAWWITSMSSEWISSASTRKTVEALDTLDYLASTSWRNTNIGVSVYMNGDQVWSGVLEGGETVSVDLETLTGPNTVEIQTSGTGTLSAILDTQYWFASGLEGSSINEDIPRGVASFAPAQAGDTVSVNWNITKVNEDGSIETNLYIHTTEVLHYIIVEIPIPPGYTPDTAGLEAQGYYVDTVTPILGIPFHTIEPGDIVINITLKPTIGSVDVPDALFPPRIFEMYNNTFPAYATVTGVLPSVGESQPPGGTGPQQTGNQTNNTGQPQPGPQPSISGNRSGGVGGGEGGSSTYLAIVVVLLIVAAATAYLYLRVRRR